MSPDPDPILPQMVRLPGGDFTMGHDQRRRDERPAHRVRLRPFAAARAPVSNAEYDRFVAATGAEPARFRDDPCFAGAALPVVGVSWDDAVAYCDWLSRVTDGSYRLPTEAEREFAALGGRQGVDWPWGDADPADYAPLAFVSQTEAPHVPSQACANDYGLRCMAENVHEWCSDWYARDSYAASRFDDPRGPAPTRRRASRGGSWRHRIKFTRVSARSSLDPGYRYNDYGFRLYADA